MTCSWFGHAQTAPGVAIVGDTVGRNVKPADRTSRQHDRPPDWSPDRSIGAHGEGSVLRLPPTEAGTHMRGRFSPAVARDQTLGICSSRSDPGAHVNPQLRDVYKNMLRHGLNALALANWHEHYMHLNETSNMAVLSAAHAAEILIKARIAQEHPLLIFEHIPKVTQSKSKLLEFEDLFTNGRTLDYADLPARLWAATGITVPALERYKTFGKVRNAIQHFAPPGRLDTEVSAFIYEVIDPFIHSCWGLYAIDYNEDSERHAYLIKTLIQRGISFRISPDASESWDFTCEVLDDEEKVTTLFARLNSEAKALRKKVHRTKSQQVRPRNRLAASRSGQTPSGVAKK